MKLYCGSAFPLDNGGYVVTLVCPNEGSYERLKIELAGINPDAYAPEIAWRETGSATGGGMATHHVDPGPDLPPAVIALAEMQSDEPPFNGPDSPGEAAP